MTTMEDDDFVLRLSPQAIADLEALMNQDPRIIPELIDLMVKYGWEDFIIVKDENGHSVDS